MKKAKEIFKYNFENITSIIKVDIKELQDKLKIINENINKINSFRSKNIEEEYQIEQTWNNSKGSGIFGYRRFDIYKELF